MTLAKHFNKPPDRCSSSNANPASVGNRNAIADASAAQRERLPPNVAMDALAEKLDTKLRTWKPETAAEVRERVAEAIELADSDVLDILDEPPTPTPVRCGWPISALPRRGGWLGSFRGVIHDSEPPECLRGATSAAAFPQSHQESVASVQVPGTEARAAFRCFHG